MLQTQTVERLAFCGKQAGRNQNTNHTPVTTVHLRTHHTPVTTVHLHTMSGVELKITKSVKQQKNLAKNQKKTQSKDIDPK